MDELTSQEHFWLSMIDTSNVQLWMSKLWEMFEWL
mgnify:CR=1 FL=1